MFTAMGTKRAAGPYASEASREARQLARVAEALASKAESAGHLAVAAKWLAVATFLRDISDGTATVVTHGRLLDA